MNLSCKNWKLSEWDKVSEGKAAKIVTKLREEPFPEAPIDKLDFARCWWLALTKTDYDALKGEDSTLSKKEFEILKMTKTLYWLKICVNTESNDTEAKNASFYFLWRDIDREEYVRKIIQDQPEFFEDTSDDREREGKKRGNIYYESLAIWFLKRYDLATAARLIWRLCWLKSNSKTGYWEKIKKCFVRIFSRKSQQPHQPKKRKEQKEVFRLFGRISCFIRALSEDIEIFDKLFKNLVNNLRAASTVGKENSLKPKFFWVKKSFENFMQTTNIGKTLHFGADSTSDGKKDTVTHSWEPREFLTKLKSGCRKLFGFVPLFIFLIVIRQLHQEYFPHFDFEAVCKKLGSYILRQVLLFARDWSFFTTILTFAYLLFSIILALSCLRKLSLWFKLFLPRMVGGIVVGYLPLLIGDESWRLVKGLNDSQSFLIFLGALLFSFYYLFIEIQNTVQDKKISFMRTLQVYPLGLLESIIIGLVILDLVTEAVMPDFISASKLVPCLFGSIYPKSLVLYFPLALLIGIFVQVIWEDKPITHPL